MDGVSSLQERVGALTELVDVDPGVLNGENALEWAKTLVHVRNLSDALLAPVASRLDALSSGPTGFARWKGFPSASALLASATGLAQADVTRLIDLGRAMTREVEVPASAGAPGAGELELGAAVEPPALEPPLLEPPLLETTCPEPPVAAVPTSETPPRAMVRVLSPLAQAARDGSLGEPKVRAIAKTLDDITVDSACSVDLEEFLVGKARLLPLKELRLLCLREFARLDPAGYADRQTVQRGERKLTFYARDDGMVGVTGQLDVETAGHVLAWFDVDVDVDVDVEVKAAMHAQRGWDEAEQRTIVQINADILAALARHATGCDTSTTRPKTTMVVRVSEESLRERVGVGSCDSLEAPISVERLRRMAIDAEVLPVVMGGRSMPLDVGRAKRYFTPAQRIALGERDQGCALCHAPATWCDAHHIDWWSHGGDSNVLNGATRQYAHERYGRDKATVVTNDSVRPCFFTSSNTNSSPWGQARIWVSTSSSSPSIPTCPTARC